MSELKNAIAEFEKTFSDFKAANDARLNEVAKQGYSRSDVDQKVDRINAALTEQEIKIKDALKAADEAALSAQRNALTGGGKATDDIRAHAAQFFSAVAGKDVTPADADVEAYKAYGTAFSAYLRRGAAASRDIQNAMSVGSDPDGGYFVKPDMSGRIAQLVFESSPIRQIASVQNISTDAHTGSKDLDEASAGWVGETSSRDATNTPQIGEWRIPVHEMHASPKVTQKLLDDASINVESWLTGKVADKFARLEADAFINGDGVLKPRGFLTYSHGVPSSSTWNVIERVASGATGALNNSDEGDPLINVVFKLKAQYRQRARWVMSRVTLAAVRKIKDGNDQYIWQPNFAQERNGLLLGYPITEAEDMPDLESGQQNLPIAFGDFSAAYQIVDRTGIRVLRDPFTAKPYIVFYSTKRVGGDVVNFEAIKLLRASASTS